MWVRTLLCAFAMTLCQGALAENSIPITHYDATVHIEPGKHYLEATIEITDPPASIFYLHKGLKIYKATADGKPVTFHDAEQAPPIAFIDFTRAVEVSAPHPHKLKLTYGGEINAAEVGINMITPELVELAIYSSWYPVFSLSQRFTFTLHSTLPDSYGQISNGNPVNQVHKGHQTTATFISHIPGFDMVLAAVPDLQTVVTGQGDEKVSLHFKTKPNDDVQITAHILTAGLHRLTELYGPTPYHGGLRVFYTPRPPTTAYSRLPLIVMIMANEKVQADKEMSARFQRIILHEMAHFWWMIADPNTENGWIDESLADYSSYRLAQEYYGDDAAKAYTSWANKQLNHNSTSDAIAETQPDAQDKEINWYPRGALMFIDAEKAFGRDKLDDVLRALHGQYARTHNATTADFLTLVAEKMGPQAAVFFHERLYAKPIVKTDTTRH